METAANSARRALWSWTEIVADLESRLEETGGEVTPDVAALEELSGEEARFAVAEFVRAFKDFKFKHQACNAAAQHYRERAEANADHMRRCKARIDELLVHLGEDKVSAPAGTAYYSSGREQVEIVEDEGVLRQLAKDGLADTRITPRKKEIFAQLKAGFDVNGCALVRGERSLVIK